MAMKLSLLSLVALLFIQSAQSKNIIVIGHDTYSTMSVSNYNWANIFRPDGHATVRAQDNQVAVDIWGKTLHEFITGEEYTVVIGDLYIVLGDKIYFKDGTNRMLTSLEQAQIAQYKQEAETKMKQWQEQFQANMNQWRAEFQQWMQDKGYMNGVPTPVVKQPPTLKLPSAPVFYP